jgi:tRNA-specific 2-thiouridylase
MAVTSKALIAMSGGVDSSVAAYLTQQAGFDCIGVTMKLLTGSTESGCCSLEDVEDARSVARRLGFPFYVFNFTDAFQTDVMTPFAESYLRGETPNPCIDCNRHLKFDRLLRRAPELGCVCIVTGHYARIEEENGRFLLKTAVDQSKDQTYFLCSMTQHQLAHTRFPLGGLHKTETRAIAEELGLCNARKHDSQDICFIPDGDYLRFLEDYTGQKAVPGDLIDMEGNVLGHHRGAAGYTLGQRRGLGVAAGERVYVCGKSMADNTVTLGPESALFSTQLLADDVNWIAFDELAAPLRVQAKTRSRQAPQAATVYPEGNGTIRVVFDDPQRAVTSGQTVALYDGEIVVGGATIRSTAP